MKLSLGQAAIEAGVSKSTISRAIKLGHLSAGRRQNGPGYEIDPAELFRVYPKKPSATLEEPVETASVSDETKIELKILQAADAEKTRLVESLQDQIEDLKKQRDSWQVQAESQTRLLVHKKEQEPVKKGFLAKFFG